MSILITSQRLLNFKNHLSLCLGFCYDRIQDEGNQSGIYRNAELEPAATSVLPDSCHTKPSHDLFVRFDEFVSARLEKTSHLAVPEAIVQAELLRPKALLLTDFAKSLFDGSVAPETNGFINNDCIPPWDCWVDFLEVDTSYGGLCLVSWIPPSLSEQVDFSINVDAAECMSWLKHVNGRLEVFGWGQGWHSGK